MAQLPQHGYHTSPTHESSRQQNTPAGRMLRLKNPTPNKAHNVILQSWLSLLADQLGVDD